MKPENWRAKYDTLLALLFRIRNDPGVRYQDLRMTVPAVESLHKVLEQNKRYEWRKTGTASYLWPLYDKQASAVAVVVKEGAAKFAYTVLARGRRQVTEYETTEAKAKQAIEKHFETLKLETD